MDALTGGHTEKHVTAKQRFFNFLLAVAPLLYNRLHGQEAFESLFIQSARDFLFKAGAGVEGVPFTISGCGLRGQGVVCAARPGDLCPVTPWGLQHAQDGVSPTRPPAPRR